MGIAGEEVGYHVVEENVEVELAEYDLTSGNIVLEDSHEPLIEDLEADNVSATNDRAELGEGNHEEIGNITLENSQLPKMFNCKTCGKECSKKRFAVNHCVLKHWRCNKCGEIIKQTNNINRHKIRCQKQAQKDSSSVQSQTKDNDGKCRYCGKVYKNPASLKTHISVKHKEEKGGDFGCDNCDFRTTEKNQLSKHLTMKHKPKVKFHCGKCAYFCFSKSGLYKHCAITHKGSVQGSESDDLGNKDLTDNSDPAADTVARSAEIEIEVENSEFETFVLTE